MTAGPGVGKRHSITKGPIDRKFYPCYGIMTVGVRQVEKIREVQNDKIYYYTA